MCRFVVLDFVSDKCSAGSAAEAISFFQLLIVFALLSSVLTIFNWKICRRDCAIDELLNEKERRQASVKIMAGNVCNLFDISRINTQSNMTLIAKTHPKYLEWKILGPLKWRKTGRSVNLFKAFSLQQAINPVKTEINGERERKWRKHCL